jgi:dihydroflavonol-4-reductase
VKNILVTGATGCLGSNLIIELLRQGYSVRAFHRETSNTITLKGIDVEHIVGDILDRESLSKAIYGCDAVFHTAALVTFWKRRRREQFEINVQGTKNVVEICLELGIEKLVHTSSVAAVGYRTDRELIDENTLYNWGVKYSYRYTKHLSELEVLQGVKNGLNAVIVNPSIIIGPRDINAHGGTIVKSIKHNRIPVYVDGGINIVSVYDVIAGEIASALRGQNGERYILGGVNITHKDVFRLAANISDGQAPKIKVPTWLVKSAAKVLDLIGDITRIHPPLTSDLVAAAGLYNWYSIEKAKRELNYQPTSIEVAMKEAYKWYVENGLI